MNSEGNNLLLNFIARFAVGFIITDWGCGMNPWLAAAIAFAIAVFDLAAFGLPESASEKPGRLP